MCGEREQGDSDAGEDCCHGAYRPPFRLWFAAAGKPRSFALDKIIGRSLKKHINAAPICRIATRLTQVT
jgi:hypothetical protein